MQAPKAKQINKTLEIHNDQRIDPYYWLNERENPEVIAYLEAENAYTKAEMAHTENAQKSLFEEMKGRIKEDDSSVPYILKGFWYYSRYRVGEEYPLYCRKKESLEADEEIILNQNTLAEGHAFHALAGLSISPNSQIIAFGEDTLSRRIYTLRFKDLETGAFLPDKLENTSGSAAWCNDNKTLFYTQKDASLRSYKIFKHVLGTPQSEDVEVFHETDETFNCYVYRSKSDAYIIIGSSATLANEYRYLSTDSPNDNFTLFLPREREHEYSLAHFGEHFYVLSNWQAKNFRLMRCNVGVHPKSEWEEVIAHRNDVFIEDVELFNDFLVLGERKNGLTHLRIKPWQGEGEHYIEFNDPTYVAYGSINRDADTEWFRYGYSSMTTPSTVFEYNMRSREQKVLKQQEVVGGHMPEDYISERLFATAQDGTKIPISLVYHKNVQKNGKNPLLLYGYGSYGASMDAGFSSIRLSLLNRGFVYAIAHIRGGEEMGRIWYEEGKLLKKMNTFTDFIACAEHLIQQGFSNNKQMYAMGGSAGGLLMGAIINLCPDLWNGIIASVPFVDVVTTMLDESIPLTTGEYDEWGNPNDEEYYHYMKSYSPYDNVKAQAYPHILITTGLHDSQVQYWEPAKWVAKLRTLKTNNTKLLLETNMEAGHGGASGRFESLKETAMEFAFLLDLEGREA
jgi:oligopeptidase B